MQFRSSAAAAALGLAVIASNARADFIEIEPIQVGSGLVSSYVQIDFLNGPTHVFEVFHDNNNTTGMDLLYTLDTELGDQFILDYDEFDFGNIIKTLGFDGIEQTSDSGQGLFWLYWVREGLHDPWAFSGEGKTSRIVSSGTWDGWVFGGGIDDPPLAVKLIPAPPATIALAGLLIIGRRRRRAA